MDMFQKLVFEFEPTVKEINEFVDYLLMFYGKGEIYDCGMTEKTARECALKYLEGNYPCVEENWIEDEFGNPVPTHLWGGGDTLDREKCLEIYNEEVAYA